jgi:hypothetical protein
MEQSILKSTKKILGIEPDDTSYDLDIVTHINSAFSTLTDLGLGPDTGYVIADESAVWDDFLPDEDYLPDDIVRLNTVKLSKIKTYIYLRTRLLFDPPMQSFLLDALKAQIQEAEWRLNTNREETEWVDPDPPEPLPPLVPDPDIGFGL